MWRYFGGVPEFSFLSAAGIQVGMIGKREFDYGWDHLKQALGHVVFPMVLSNVSISDPEVARKFVRNVIVPAGDLKVGFFAMLSTWLFSVTRKTDELVVLTDTEGIAREMVADLRAQGADVIVMLSNLSEGENRHLAESVPGIHAIVGRASTLAAAAEPCATEAGMSFAPWQMPTKNTPAVLVSTGFSLTWLSTKKPK